MLELERLSLYLTKYVTLELIAESKGSVNSIHALIEDIFIRQLSLNKALDFNKELYLCCGDQATLNILAIKRENAIDNDLYESKAWVGGVPRLFHLQLYVIDAICDGFQGLDDDQAALTIRSHTIRLSRKQVLVSEVPFTQIESIVRDSANARMLAFVYKALQDNSGYTTTDFLNDNANVNFKHYPDIQERIGKQTKAYFIAVVRQAYNILMLKEVQLPAANVLRGLTPETSDNDAARPSAS